MEAGAVFFAFSALGVCGDTTARLERKLDDQIMRYIAEDQQLQVATAIKERPISMQAPCTNGRAALRVHRPANKLLRMQRAFAAADSRTLDSLLTSVSTGARTQRPGDVASRLHVPDCVVASSQRRHRWRNPAARPRAGLAPKHECPRPARARVGCGSRKVHGAASGDCSRAPRRGGSAKMGRCVSRTLGNR